jgi:hypothetical protein
MITYLQPTIIEQLRDEANDKIDHILSALGIDIDNSYGFTDEIRCACPVHNGDNATSFVYNIKYKQWRCYTKRCHDGNGSIFSLVQKILSKQESRDIGFVESAVWLANQIGFPLPEDSRIDPSQMEFYNLLKEGRNKKKLVVSKQENKENFPPIPIEAFKNKIEPSWYFLEQGFDDEILRKYNVGYCDNPRKPMYLRSYAPVLDATGKLVVGVTGRIRYEGCPYCSMFHEHGNGCPKDNPRVKGYAKWIHHGFSSSAILYNSWFAERYIRDSRIAVITEGPKDVWWLEQHGIHNSLCIFGLNISQYHLKRLIGMGVSKLVVALDNDERGIEAMESINNTLANYFTMININTFLSSGEDIADTPTGRMEKEIKPYLKSLEYKYA